MFDALVEEASRMKALNTEDADHGKRKRGKRIWGQRGRNEGTVRDPLPPISILLQHPPIGALYSFAFLLLPFLRVLCGERYPVR
jgi:hypothetical protein